MEEIHLSSTAEGVKNRVLKDKAASIYFAARIAELAELVRKYSVKVNTPVGTRAFVNKVVGTGTVVRSADCKS